jgi:hypothetical protein
MEEAMTADDARPTAGAQATPLGRLINGYQVSQAIHVAAELGIADLLADGPRSSDDLAVGTQTHPEALYRLLAALASIGVLHEEAEREFSLTALGEPLRSDSPQTLRGWARHIGRPYYWEAWAHLLHSIRTGESAFRHIHGTDPWGYRASRPEDSAVFDDAMAALTRHAHGALLAEHDFGRFRKIVDIGGGNGALLAAVLSQHPGVEGIVFDQPHVVAGAEVVLEAAGVAERCRIVGGDFFDSVPSGGDAYVLKQIVHDWEDGEATAILRTVRAAISPTGSLLVIERELGAPNEDPQAKFSDLNMLVALGARERTLEQFGTLFERAGFRLVGSTRTTSGWSVIEGRPA